MNTGISTQRFSLARHLTRRPITQRACGGSGNEETWHPPIRDPGDQNNLTPEEIKAAPQVLPVTQSHPLPQQFRILLAEEEAPQTEEDYFPGGYEGSWHPNPRPTSDYNNLPEHEILAASRPLSACGECEGDTSHMWRHPDLGLPPYKGEKKEIQESAEETDPKIIPARSEHPGIVQRLEGEDLREHRKWEREGVKNPWIKEIEKMEQGEPYNDLKETTIASASVANIQPGQRNAVLRYRRKGGVFSLAPGQA